MEHIDGFIKKYWNIISIFFRVIDVFVIGIVLQLFSNRILKQQLEVEMNKYQPFFDFQFLQTDDIGTKDLMIYTIGEERYHNLSIELKPVIHINNDNQDLIKVPLRGLFYDKKYTHTSTSSRSIDFNGYKENWPKYINLARGINDFDIGPIDIYIKIEYTDMFGEIQNKFYMCHFAINSPLYKSNEAEFNEIDYDLNDINYDPTIIMEIIDLEHDTVQIATGKIYSIYKYRSIK